MDQFKQAAGRPLMLVFVLIALVAIQPDFGNAAILTLITIVMVLASGINYMYTYLVGGLGILGSITAIQLLIMSKGKIFPARYQYIYNRFAVLKSILDERNLGHQLANSYYAISNGGWFGKGLGNSVQKKAFTRSTYGLYLCDYFRRVRHYRRSSDFRIVDVYDCANYFSRCTLEETF